MLSDKKIDVLLKELNAKMKNALTSIREQSDLNEDGGYSHDYTVGFESGFSSAMIKILETMNANK